MHAIEKNDRIILKGTSFKSKPLFSSFVYPKFDGLVLHLMQKYGESITNGEPIKGKEDFYWYPGEIRRSKPVPIPLQPYFRSICFSMLLVVGSDTSDTLILTSPITENVRRFFGFSKWSRKDENYEYMLKKIEIESQFVPLTYNCRRLSLEKDWHKTVHLRKRDTVELYVVPKPLEYFPMLFINCSMDNVRHMYDNITSLLISRNDPMYYSPYQFTCVIFKPLMFNIVDNRIEHRQRLPGIDVTEDQFVAIRRERLDIELRYMVSDCRCRSNTVVLSPHRSKFVCPWDRIERAIYNNFIWNYLVPCPPAYTPKHCKCSKCYNEAKD